MIDVAGVIGDNLKRLREAADLSQDELAMRSSVHRTEVSQIERGLRIPRADTVVKLSGSLEVTPSDLLAGLSWEPGEVRIGRFASGDAAEP